MATRPKRAFTDLWVASAKPESGKDRVEIGDPGTANLYLMITSKGAKSWVWRARHVVTKKPLKRTLGSYPTHSLADAIEWAKAQTKARDTGHDHDVVKEAAQEAAKVQAAVAAAEATKTFDWFFTDLYSPRFIEGKKAGAEARRIYEKDVKPFLGNKVLTTITTDDLDDCVDRVIKRGSMIAANRLVVHLKAWFKRARTDFRRQTALPGNPAELLVKPTAERKRERWLDEPEIKYLLRAMDEKLEGSERTHADCLLLCLETGCRLDEARGLAWSEIDFKEGTWTLPKARNKADVNFIYVPAPATMKRLQERHAAQAKALGEKKPVYVFASTTDAGIPFNSLSKPMAKLLAKMRAIAAKDGVTIERWSAHVLRHSFKTHLAKAAETAAVPEITPFNLERAMNHMEPGIGGRYDQWQYLGSKRVIFSYWRDRLDLLAKA